MSADAPVDSWTGLDKLEHFVACAVATAASYFLFRAHFLLYRRRFLFSILVGVLGGALKELLDGLGVIRGDPSWKDFTADVLGSLAAAGILWLCERRYGVPPPPPPPYPYTGFWSLLGFRKEPRVVDLEAGLVYGQRIGQRIGNSIKDLRSLIPHSSALAGWGRLEGHGYKPLAVGGDRGGRGGTSKGGGSNSSSGGGSTGGHGLGLSVVEMKAVGTGVSPP